MLTPLHALPPPPAAVDTVGMPAGLVATRAGGGDELGSTWPSWAEPPLPRLAVVDAAAAVAMEVVTAEAAAVLRGGEG
eukprot:1146334-Pelagomonas_calceolata.AAC.1